MYTLQGGRLERLLSCWVSVQGRVFLPWSIVNGKGGIRCPLPKIKRSRARGVNFSLATDGMSGSYGHERCSLR